jgi:hypothetical protein
VPDDWKVKGEERRKLFRRYIDFQMRHVQEEVFKYVSEVRSDMCIRDITEDIPDIMFHAFGERPRDPKVVEEMRKIWNTLTEKADGRPTDESNSLSRPEQAGFN